jgi:hypothetical protein
MQLVREMAARRAVVMRRRDLKIMVVVDEMGWGRAAGDGMGTG